MIARTLAATGHLVGLHAVLRADDVGEELWRGLIHVLRFESPLFSEADLQTVETAAVHPSNLATEKAVAEVKRTQDAGGYRVVRVPGSELHRVVTPMHDAVDEARSVISRIRYLRLAKTIREGQNPAIDADRQVLLSRLEALGFSDKLSRASNEIEKRAVVAATDTDVKSVMDLLRTFYEEFIEEACHKVEVKAGKAAPASLKVNHFAPYRQYLENNGFVGREESELLQKLYNFLSNQGAHKLGTAPEQLRVAHATVVEWCMLIAGRISNFLRHEGRL